MLHSPIKAMEGQGLEELLHNLYKAMEGMNGSRGRKEILIDPTAIGVDKESFGGGLRNKEGGSSLLQSPSPLTTLHDVVRLPEYQRVHETVHLTPAYQYHPATTSAQRYTLLPGTNRIYGH